MELKEQNIIENENLTECSHCGDEFNIDDLVEIDGELYCDECKCENFCYCEHCDTWVDNSDILNINDEFVCQTCADNHFYKCDECGDFIHGDDVIYTAEGHVCNTCCDDYYRYCAGCGEYHHEDYSYYNDYRGEYYCENCYNDYREQEFESQYFNTELFNTSYSQTNSTRCYGIELEIEDCELPYNDIECNTIFGCKEDGSLSEGSEFYSPILRGDKGIEEIKKFCDIVKYNSVGNGAGFHLHIDTRDLTVEQIKKVYYLYRIIDNDIFRTICSSRIENSYCQPLQVKHKAIRNVIDKEGFYKTCKGDRYFGFNIDSVLAHNTIEIRYHHGTINFEEIKNWIKLHLSFVQYGLKHSNEDFIRLTKELKTIKNQKGRLRKIIYTLTRDKALVDFYVKQYETFWA